MQEFNILLNGNKVRYRSAGEGPLLVLLHGFGEDGGIWKAQFNAFPHHRVLIPNLPGMEGTDPIPDMSMEGLAAFLRHLVVSLKGGYQKLVLVGHSMGGYIALAYAEAFGESLDGLVLFSSTAFADSEEKKETRRKGIEFIEKQGGALFLKTSTPNLYGSATKANNPQLIEEHITGTRNFLDTALVSYYKAMMNRKDRTEILKNASYPVCFFLGTEDNAVPLQDGLKLAIMPNLSYIHVLASSGHMGMIEEKDKSTELLIQFLKDLEKQQQPE